MLSHEQLHELIICPVLSHLEIRGQRAISLAILLHGTCAAESAYGTYLAQVGGPALGIYQMEPATHRDIWINYLSNRPYLRDSALGFAGFSREEAQLLPTFDSMIRDLEDQLIWNLRYATLMAALHYIRTPEIFPGATFEEPINIEDFGAYWKRWYNTVAGKGSVKGFMEKWKAAKLPVLYNAYTI